MNILFVTHAPPDEPRDGARLIVYHLARLLAAEHSLYVCALLPAAERADVVRARLAERFTASALAPMPKRPRTVKWAEQARVQAPLWIRAHDVPAMRMNIASMLASYAIDVAHCDTGLMAQYADTLENIPRIVAPHDALTNALETQAAQAHSAMERMAARMQIRKMRRYESHAYAQFDRTVVVTARERDKLHAFAPHLNVAVIPNGVDADYFAPMPNTQETTDLAFVGVLNSVANSAAATYFATSILPRVWKTLPDATLTIVGREPPAQVRALAKDARIRVTGAVEDVRPYVAGARVVVCPMRASGGIKNKLLEALAMGKAVVATPEAAEGTDARDGQELVLAGEADAFAAACALLLGNPARRAELGTRARAWALKQSWQAVAEQYADLYETVVRERRAVTTPG